MVRNPGTFTLRNLNARFKRTWASVVVAILGALVVTTGLLLHSTRFPDWRVAGGLFVLVLAIITLTTFHFRHTDLKGNSAETAGQIALLGAVASIYGVVLLTRTFDMREATGVGFLLTAPLIAQAMLTSALIGPPLSVFVLTVTTFLLGVGDVLPIETLAVGWISGAVAAHTVNPIRQRNDLLRAMGVVALANAVIACGATAMLYSSALPVLASAGWAVLASVLACSIFWMSVAVVERMFNLVSDFSILELCSPEHPLLRELVLRAPGTYAHSVMVGNLAENAAREIGANPTLCRALAYFHDIGKLSRPSYFIENQQGDNIHDTLPPKLSARVIRQHVVDGLEMAKQHRLPKIIQDGIAEHHGTALLSYFYQRACEQDPERATNLEPLFRYPGPKPSSRESAILHLADSIEAISRLFPRGQTEELEIAISKNIEERRADGQLDDCDLTFKELRRIQASFLRTLSALRHERIAYPEEISYAEERDDHLDLKKLASSSERPEDA